MKRSGIYQILNSLDGKRYIGSAVDLHKRWLLHKWELGRGIHFNPHLQSAWRLYGADTFEFSVIKCVADPAQLIEHEQRFLDAFFPELYNLAPIAGNCLGIKMGSDSRRKMSIAQRKRPPASEETRRKLSEAATGRVLGPQSAEHRRKLSEAKKGKKKPPRSEETRRKISTAQKLNWAAGVYADNMMQHQSGECNRAAKLSEPDVREIRALLAQGVVGTRLSEQYGVSTSAISNIKLRRTWSHIEEAASC